MRKYALLRENVVIAVELLTDEQCVEKSKEYQLVIDVQDMLVTPVAGYILSGNTLIPTTQATQVEMEEDLAAKKCLEGSKISNTAIIRLGALNKIMNKTGTQVSQVLNNMLSVKMLLETGALGTARSIMSQLISVYPEYNEILTEAINKINDFESKYGL